jgi:hypothetical protein
MPDLDRPAANFSNRHSYFREGHQRIVQMLSAPNRRQQRIEFPRPQWLAAPAALPAIPSIAPLSATLATHKGDFLTGAIARIRERSGGWTALLSNLDQPGHVASMYFAFGLRDVVMRLEDGRRARARITGTRFSSGERVCEIAGLEPLA